jgi:DNA-binding LacI/PurR family transcriptional regulator
MASIIETIARNLNTSTASVSRALNDRPGVSETLRVRIIEEAQRLNYAPSASARGLATSTTFAVGFFVHDKPGLSTSTDPFYGEILHGAEVSFSQTAYHLAIASLTDAVLSRPASFRFTRERRVDGMILAGPDIPSDFILAMISTGVPVVLVDNRLEHAHAHSVCSDDEGGAFEAAQLLIALGHRHIGVLSGPPTWWSNRRRVEGYSRALHEAGLPAEIVCVERTTVESGEEAFRRLMQAAPDVTAVCAVNDSMAIGAIRAARAQKRRIPDDMSVIGFDDIAWAELNYPPLSTVSIPKRQMGIEAANRLIQLLEDPNQTPTTLMLDVLLVQRASCGAPSQPRR